MQSALKKTKKIAELYHLISLLLIDGKVLELCLQMVQLPSKACDNQCVSQKILLQDQSGPLRLVLGASFLGKGPREQYKGIHD